MCNARITRRNEFAHRREIEHIRLAIRVLELQISFLKTTSKIISMREFKVLQAEKSELTQRLTSAILGMNEFQSSQNTFVSRYRGRPGLRLIYGGKQC
jgi:hypothetical protein